MFPFTSTKKICKKTEMFTNTNRKLSFNRNEKLMTFKHSNFVKCTMYLWMKTQFPKTFVPNKNYYII